MNIVRLLVRSMPALKWSALGLVLAGSGLSAGTPSASAQAPRRDKHYLHERGLPPGQIGQMHLARKRPLAGYYQPVEFRGPEGTQGSLVVDQLFDEPQTMPFKAGLLVAPVYRLRITNIPNHPGEEVFPTIEMVDRLYPPPGHAWRFPVPIEISQEDLELALEGKFVTRVIYVENPNNALPSPNYADHRIPAKEDTDASADEAETGPRHDYLPGGMAEVAGAENLDSPRHRAMADQANRQRWIDVIPGDDPLALATDLGRPIAILRIGGRVPLHGEMPDPAFLGDRAPWLKLPRVEAPADEGMQVLPTSGTSELPEAAPARTRRRRTP